MAQVRKCKSAKRSKGKPATITILRPRTYKNKDGSVSKYPRFRSRNPLTGKYVFRQFKDLNELHEERIKIEGEIQAGTHQPLSDNPTLAEFAWQYYDDKKAAGLAVGSLKNMEIRLRVHILGGRRDTAPGEYLYLGDYKLRELKPSIIKEWTRTILHQVPPEHLLNRGTSTRRAKPREMPRSRDAVLWALGLLEDILQAALNLEMPGLIRNAAAKVEVQNAEAERESELVEEGVDFMTPKEAMDILDYARFQLSDPRWYPLVATYLFTGARSGELRALHWEDVRFDKEIIRIRWGMDQFRNRGKTKTRHGNRDVPLVPPLSNILIAWKPICPREGATSRLGTSEANVLRVVRLLRLNPWMSNEQVARLLRVGADAVRAIRNDMGLPKFQKGVKSHLKRPVIMPVDASEQDDLVLPDGLGRLLYVFPTRKGDDLEHHTIWSRVVGIQSALGLIKKGPEGNPILDAKGKPRAKYGPHAFRHFYVSYLAYLGFKMEDVAKFVGHSDETMTKHYRHFFPDTEKEQQHR
jgi:integrase